MSPYDGSDRPGRRNRGVLGPWVPLIMTVAVATIGVAAWVWSERDDDEDENDQPRRRRRADDERNYPPSAPSYSTEVRPGEAGYGTASRSAPGEDNQGWGQRMSGALRRTPSPQQFLEGASRTVSAGITAAGAAVGNALSSIREEDKNAYRDHQTWLEEAEKRKESGAVLPATAKSVAKATAYTGKKMKVAVVVSADADLDGEDDGLDYSETHASILSHLPQNTDFSRVELYVLIFSPNITQHPLEAAKASTSLGSSYAEVAVEGSTEISNKLAIERLFPETPAFNKLWSEAEDVVQKNTMILPFTKPDGHLPILRALKPDCVYLQNALSGRPDGSHIEDIRRWLQGEVVVVVGGDHGDGGLADSDDETAQKPSTGENWWEKEERVGKGRGVSIVDHLHVSDDWAKRIENKE